MEDIIPGQNNEILNLKRKVEELEKDAEIAERDVTLAHDKISFLASILLDILKGDVKLNKKINPETEELLLLYIEDYSENIEFEIELDDDKRF